jgi:hypothetical protein
MRDSTRNLLLAKMGVKENLDQRYRALWISSVQKEGAQVQRR